MQYRILLLLAVGLIIAGLWGLLVIMGMPQSFAPGALSHWLQAQGMFGPLLLVLLMILAVVVGPLPTLPISATAGLAFGMLWGTLIAALGALVGALIAFFIARSLGREAFRRRFGEHPLFARDGSQRFLTLGILFTRLVPLFSFALISYAAGVTAITPWRFALATFVGMLPMTLVFAGLGQTLEVHPVLTVVAALVVLLVMSLLPWVLGRYPNSRLARLLGLGR